MFIVWGKKLVYQNLGYVADFCLICRGPRAFSIRRIGIAGHVYYISMGVGELIGWERKCLECNTTFQADPSNYKSQANKLGTIELLIAETYPSFAEAWGERITLEQRIKKGSSDLSVEERTSLIYEPFLILSPMVEARFASIHLDKEVGFAALGAIGLLIAIPSIASATMYIKIETAWITAFALSFLLVIWQIATTGRRYLHRVTLPTLAIALRPLQPNDSELNAVLAVLKSHGHKIGLKLRAVDLLASINQYGNGHT